MYLASYFHKHLSQIYIVEYNAEIKIVMQMSKTNKKYRKPNNPSGYPKFLLIIRVVLASMPKIPFPQML